MELKEQPVPLKIQIVLLYSQEFLKSGLLLRIGLLHYYEFHFTRLLRVSFYKVESIPILGYEHLDKC